VRGKGEFGHLTMNEGIAQFAERGHGSLGNTVQTCKSRERELKEHHGDKIGGGGKNLDDKAGRRPKKKGRGNPTSITLEKPYPPITNGIRRRVLKEREENGGGLWRGFKQTATCQGQTNRQSDGLAAIAGKEIQTGKKSKRSKRGTTEGRGERGSQSAREKRYSGRGSRDALREAYLGQSKLPPGKNRPNGVKEAGTVRPAERDTVKSGWWNKRMRKSLANPTMKNESYTFKRTKVGGGGL